MKQLVHIHGGESFDTYDEYIAFVKHTEIDDPQSEKSRKWRDSYEENLSGDWQIVRPKMPCSWNAKYKEWEIWFKKYEKYIEEDVVLVGNSLGAAFLVQYLLNHTLPVRISSLHLIAGPFGRYADFTPPDNLEQLTKQCSSIFIYHSKDDPVVPFSHAEEYKQALPKAELVVFEDRGHFLQEKFPELMKRIQRA